MLSMMGILVLLLSTLAPRAIFVLLGISLTTYFSQGCESPLSVSWGVEFPEISCLLAAMAMFLLPVTLFYYSRPLVIMFLMMMLAVVAFMGCHSSLWFYVFFELSVIPMVVMVMGWGKQPERLTASVYMLLYTVASSLPFLGILVFGSIGYFWCGGTAMSGYPSVILIAPFCVKLPMFYVHVWLPKAHVEAPAFGSMVLAATLLKMGSFGMWRISPLLSYSVGFNLGLVGALGAAMCSVAAACQTDAKSLVAYSSVVHMGLLMFSTLSMRVDLVSAATMMMVSHGVCSSGLFYGVTLIYERVSTRSIAVMQGSMSVLPWVSFVWVLLLMSNLSAPLSVSLLSETIMFGGLVLHSASTSWWLGLMTCGVLWYSLLLFWSVSHGHIGSPMPTNPECLKEITLSSVQGMWVIASPLAYWLFEP